MSFSSQCNYVCSNYLAPTLTKIYNKMWSLSQGMEENNLSFLYTKVVLIHAEGNYKPISILNGCTWIFRAIIAEHFQFNLKHIFHENEHDFIQRKYTVINLLQTADLIQGCITKRLFWFFQGFWLCWSPHFIRQVKENGFIDTIHLLVHELSRRKNVSSET